jgi:glycosyltransferase involved in cell wall biosynthesis
MYRDIAADNRVDLLVLFVEAGAAPKFDNGFGQVIQWQADLLDGFPYQVLAAKPAERKAAVVAALANFSPDVVYVHGYSAPYLQSAARWAKSVGAKVMMTTDSELKHRRPLHVRAAKRVVIPYLLRNVDLFLTVGDENERYFAHYGVKRERFHRATFSIDSKVYDEGLSRRDEARARLRDELGIARDAVVVLTVGKMISRKKQDILLKAFLELKVAGCDSAVLLIAGDGPERANLEALAEPLGRMVCMPGFVGVDKLPDYYMASDIYAHPSDHDPHPLAISEALYCGLPVVASDRIGSVGPTDDVQVGKNGWVYPVSDVAALVEILRHLIDHPDARGKAGEESIPLGRVHSSYNVAERFVDGALLTLRHGGKKSPRGLAAY